VPLHAKLHIFFKDVLSSKVHIAVLIKLYLPKHRACANELTARYNTNVEEIGCEYAELPHTVSEVCGLKKSNRRPRRIESCRLKRIRMNLLTQQTTWRKRKKNIK